MIANFYIIPESIKNDNLTDEQFLSSLDNFISEYYKILEFKEENKIIIQENIYEITLPNGNTLADFLYSPDVPLEGKQIAIKKFLSSIFSKLSHEQININDIKEQIAHNSLDNCYGIISLTEIEEIANENQIIYDKGSWLKFRRHHLGLFFGDSKYFIDECKKYFSELFFHDNNYNSVGKILDGFSSKIIIHLVALNDKLPDILKKSNTFKNHTDLLNYFSRESSLEEDATLQGSDKGKLKFSFINEDNNMEDVICEPHMKLCSNDSSDGHYYYNRIYFYFGKKSIEKSKILVGHIGVHI